MYYLEKKKCLHFAIEIQIIINIIDVTLAFIKRNYFIIHTLIRTKQITILLLYIYIIQSR